MTSVVSQIFPDTPFFGGNTFGVQSATWRYVFMTGLVSLLAKERKEPIRVLEIGSWIGCSALTWSAAIDFFCPAKGDVLCIDPWDQYVDKKDLSKADVYVVMDQLSRSNLSYDLFRHNISFCSKKAPIRHMRGYSQDILPYLKDRQFDIVYIDGSHYLDGVLYDLREADRLIKDGGVICGDDLELQFHECDQSFAASCVAEDYVKDPKTGRDFHPGVTVAIGRTLGPVSNTGGFWMARKNSTGYSGVSIQGAPVFVPAHLPDSVKKNLNLLFARPPSS